MAGSTVIPWEWWIGSRGGWGDGELGGVGGEGPDTAELRRQRLARDAAFALAAAEEDAVPGDGGSRSRDGSERVGPQRRTRVGVEGSDSSGQGVGEEHHAVRVGGSGKG